MMVEMWEVVRGAGSQNPDQMKLVNLKRFLCALEGIPTSKLLRRRVTYNDKTYRDEVENFYVSEKAIKAFTKQFKELIATKWLQTVQRSDSKP